MKPSPTLNPNKPDKGVLHGIAGIGKSTLASKMPNPLYINADDRLDFLDVMALPVPHDIDTVIEQLEWVEKEKHDFKTLVIDTLDSIEPLIYRRVVKDNNWTDEQAAKYKRWLNAAATWWYKIQGLVDRCREKRGMNVLIICHTKIMNFQNPTGDDYMRYVLGLQGEICPAMWTKWADTVMFATYEEITLQKPEEAKKGKAATTGERIVHTTWSPAWEAKNGFGLPETIPLSWDEYVAHKKAAVGISALDLDSLNAKVDEMMAASTMTDEDKAKCLKWLGPRKNEARLLKVIQKLETA